jgi:hypothetical protein
MRIISNLNAQYIRKAMPMCLPTLVLTILTGELTSTRQLRATKA